MRRNGDISCFHCRKGRGEFPSCMTNDQFQGHWRQFFEGRVVDPEPDQHDHFGAAVPVED